MPGPWGTTVSATCKSAALESSLHGQGKCAATGRETRGVEGAEGAQRSVVAADRRDEQEAVDVVVRRVGVDDEAAAARDGGPGVGELDPALGEAEGGGRGRLSGGVDAEVEGDRLRQARGGGRPRERDGGRQRRRGGPLC